MNEEFCVICTWIEFTFVLLTRMYFVFKQKFKKHQFFCEIVFFYHLFLRIEKNLSKLCTSMFIAKCVFSNSILRPCIQIFVLTSGEVSARPETRKIHCSVWFLLVKTFHLREQWSWAYFWDIFLLNLVGRFYLK